MQCPDGIIATDRDLVGILRRQRLDGLDHIGYISNGLPLTLVRFRDAVLTMCSLRTTYPEIVAPMPIPLVLDLRAARRCQKFKQVRQGVFCPMLGD
jgi:hypothetical protein